MNIMQFLQDNAGANSSGRLLQFLAVLVILCIYLIANLIQAWNAISGHTAFVPFPMDQYMLWALGIVAAWNVSKTVAEGKV